MDDSYYVGLKNNELVIYQGRPGGFLGMEPKIVTHTGVTADQVGPIVIPALRAGVLEPTRSAANLYVSRLVAAQCSLQNPPASCSTTTTSTGRGGSGDGAGHADDGHREGSLRWPDGSAGSVSGWSSASSSSSSSSTTSRS